MSKGFLLTALTAMAFAGCTAFTPLQTSVFTDENGTLCSVDYGRDRQDHESTFIAPNGREMSIKSRNKVRVTLSDGTSFLAWECMNPLSSGTMYRTNNKKWMFHANGISCRVFRQAVNEQTGQDDYLVVFDGIICQGSK